MTDPSHSGHPGPHWRPIPALERRVLGVLLEKAKTTPDVYPMSANGIRAGCNQKNNRYPLMEVDEEDVLESLERLRALGATVEVQGSGRVRKFKHQFYDWLGVDKVEAAVMAELLLRGTQTEGELRGRAARMEPIADVAALRPILHALKAKGLVISLTSEGRGHVVTHALYEPRELEKQRLEFAGGQSSGSAHEPSPEPRAPGVAPVASPSSGPATAGLSARAAMPSTLPSAAAPSPAVAHSAASLEDEHGGSELRAELEKLRQEVRRLRQEIDDIWSHLR